MYELIRHTICESLVEIRAIHKVEFWKNKNQIFMKKANFYFGLQLLLKWENMAEKWAIAARAKVPEIPRELDIIGNLGETTIGT